MRTLLLIFALSVAVVAAKEPENKAASDLPDDEVLKALKEIKGRFASDMEFAKRRQESQVGLVKSKREELLKRIDQVKEEYKGLVSESSVVKDAILNATSNIRLLNQTIDRLMQVVDLSPDSDPSALIKKLTGGSAASFVEAQKQQALKLKNILSNINSPSAPSELKQVIQSGTPVSNKPASLLRFKSIHIVHPKVRVFVDKTKKIVSSKRKDPAAIAKLQSDVDEFLGNLDKKQEVNADVLAKEIADRTAQLQALNFNVNNATAEQVLEFEEAQMELEFLKIKQRSFEAQKALTTVEEQEKLIRMAKLRSRLNKAMTMREKETSQLSKSHHRLVEIRSRGVQITHLIARIRGLSKHLTNLEQSLADDYTEVARKQQGQIEKLDNLEAVIVAKNDLGGGKPEDLPDLGGDAPDQGEQNENSDEESEKKEDEEKKSEKPQVVVDDGSSPVPEDANVVELTDEEYAEYMKTQDPKIIERAQARASESSDTVPIDPAHADELSDALDKAHELAASIRDTVASSAEAIKANDKAAESAPVTSTTTTSTTFSNPATDSPAAPEAAATAEATAAPAEATSAAVAETKVSFSESDRNQPLLSGMPSDVKGTRRRISSLLQNQQRLTTQIRF